MRDDSDTGPRVSTASDEVADVETVPCAQPHDFEVDKNVTVTDADEYPGTDVVGAQADHLCQAAFDDFVGFDYADSAYVFIGR